MEKKTERLQFQGTVRELRISDLKYLKPILAHWIKDRKTGIPLPEEVEEDLQIMGGSVVGANNRKYFVAESVGGEVVGVIGMRNPDDTMRKFAVTDNPVELVNAYVSPYERGGKGVGRALVKKLEEEAVKNGKTEVVLNSGPRYEKTGWGFYDKLPGYRRVGIAIRLYGRGGDAPVWSKLLK